MFHVLFDACQICTNDERTANQSRRLASLNAAQFLNARNKFIIAAADNRRVRADGIIQ